MRDSSIVRTGLAVRKGIFSSDLWYWRQRVVLVAEQHRGGVVVRCRKVRESGEFEREQ